MYLSHMFLCGLFYDVLHSLASNGRMDALERIWKEAVVSQSRCYPGNFPEELRKTTKNLNQDNR
jgi:hypothetical protein